MSRGPGRVQSAIILAFDAEPNRKFTACELAEIVFPGEQIGSIHTHTITRALRTPALEAKLNIARCRSGKLKHGGWRYVYGRAS